jgi:hypothetical protein
MDAGFLRTANEGKAMGVQQLACPRCGSHNIATVWQNPDQYPFKKSGAEWRQCEACNYICGHPEETGACSASVDFIVGVALVVVAMSALCWLALY